MPSVSVDNGRLSKIANSLLEVKRVCRDSDRRADPCAVVAFPAEAEAALFEPYPGAVRSVRATFTFFATSLWRTGE